MFNPISKVEKEKDCNDFDAASWRSVQEGLFGGIPESLNEKGEEIRYPAVGNIRQKRIEEITPSLYINKPLNFTKGITGISESFHELMFLEMSIPHALLIHPYPFDRQDFLPRTQKPGLQRTIRHIHKQQHSKPGRGKSRPKKHDPPPRKQSLSIPRTPGNRIRHDPAKDLCEHVEREPESRARTLFVFLVPLRGEEGEARCHGGFEDAEKGAHEH